MSSKLCFACSFTALCCWRPVISNHSPLGDLSEALMIKRHSVAGLNPHFKKMFTSFCSAAWYVAFVILSGKIWPSSNTPFKQNVYTATATEMVLEGQNPLQKFVFQTVAWHIDFVSSIEISLLILEASFQIHWGSTPILPEKQTLLASGVDPN